MCRSWCGGYEEQGVPLLVWWGTIRQEAGCCKGLRRRAGLGRRSWAMTRPGGWEGHMTGRGARMVYVASCAQQGSADSWTGAERRRV